MIYRLADFIYNLEQQGMGEVNMQSEKAMELINEALPRNMMLVRHFLEKPPTESQLDVEQRHS